MMISGDLSGTVTAVSGDLPYAVGSVVSGEWEYDADKLHSEDAAASVHVQIDGQDWTNAIIGTFQVDAAGLPLEFYMPGSADLGLHGGHNLSIHIPDVGDIAATITFTKASPPSAPGGLRVVG
jgi:hypothetical protein